MRFILILSLLSVIVSSISLTALSNQGTAQIKGTLLDPNDAVIPGARITFRAREVRTRAYTNEEGVFEIDLPAGEYGVEIQAFGFNRLEVKNLEVIFGMPKELKFHLEPLPGSICILRIIGNKREQIEKVPSPVGERIKPRKIQ